MKRWILPDLEVQVESEPDGRVGITWGGCVVRIQAADAMALGEALIKATMPDKGYVPVPYPVDISKLEESTKLVIPAGGA